MQVAIPSANVRTEGVLSRTKYTMVSDSAHAMFTVSAMYSDRPWAILREYGTNMLDAYIALRERNPDAVIRPPEIELPSRAHPFITLRDFGIGMTKDFVKQRYVNFFDSEKGRTQVGGLGLGCKAAHSYAAAWHIESRYEGRITHFTTYRGEDGIPTLDEVLDAPTEEPTGVTIRIPVKLEDIGRFWEATRKLAAYFPMELVVIPPPGETFHAHAPEYLIRDVSWGVLRRSHTNIVMGNVPYPLDFGQCTDIPENVMKFLTDCRGAGIGFDLWVPLGAVDFVPSREALMYTQKTVRAVAEAAAMLQRGLRQSLLKVVLKAPSRWAACRELYLRTDRVWPLREFVQDLTWRGQPVSAHGFDVQVKSLLEKFPALQITRFGSGSSVGAFKAVPMTDPYHKIPLQTANPIALYIDDLPDSAPKYLMAQRVRYSLTSRFTEGYKRRRWKPFNGAYVLRLPSGVSEATVLAAFEGFADGVPVQLVSRLPDSPKAARATKRIKGLKFITRDNTLNPDVDAETTGGFYLRQDGQDYMDVTRSHLPRMLHAAGLWGLIAPDTPIYLMPRTKATLEKKPEWIEFTGWLKRETARLVKQHGAAIRLADVIRVQARSDFMRFFDREEVRTRLQAERPRHPVVRLLKAQDEALAVCRAHDFSALDSLAVLCDIPVPPSKAADRLRVLYDETTRRCSSVHWLTDVIGTASLLSPQALDHLWPAVLAGK